MFFGRSHAGPSRDSISTGSYIRSSASSIVETRVLSSLVVALTGPVSEKLFLLAGSSLVERPRAQLHGAARLLPCVMPEDCLDVIPALSLAVVRSSPPPWSSARVRWGKVRASHSIELMPQCDSLSLFGMQILDEPTNHLDLDAVQVCFRCPSLDFSSHY